MSVSQLPEPITVPCPECGTEVITRGNVGSAAHCPNSDCRIKTFKITKAHRPEVNTTDINWLNMETETEVSEYKCATCDDFLIWTTGHTLLACITCKTQGLSPTAHKRIEAATKSSTAVATVKKSPAEEIVERMQLDANRETVIRLCEERMRELDTSQFYIYYPGLVNIMGFGNEAGAQQFRDMFKSLSNQARSETSNIKINLMFEVVRNLSADPKVTTITSCITQELNDLARRLTAINTSNGLSNWYVTREGIILPYEREDYPTFNPTSRRIENRPIARELATPLAITAKVGSTNEEIDNTNVVEGDWSEYTDNENIDDNGYSKIVNDIWEKIIGPKLAKSARKPVVINKLNYKTMDELREMLDDIARNNPDDWPIRFQLTTTGFIPHFKDDKYTWKLTVWLETDDDETDDDETDDDETDDDETDDDGYSDVEY